MWRRVRSIAARFRREFPPVRTAAVSRVRGDRVLGEPPLPAAARPGFCEARARALAGHYRRGPSSWAALRGLRGAVSTVRTPRCACRIRSRRISVCGPTGSSPSRANWAAGDPELSGNHCWTSGCKVGERLKGDLENLGLRTSRRIGISSNGSQTEHGVNENKTNFFFFPFPPFSPLLVFEIVTSVVSRQAFSVSDRNPPSRCRCE